MRRFFVILAIVAGCVVVACVLLLLFWPPPEPPTAAHPAAPAAATAPHSPLQADAAGSYIPGYAFSVNGFRFTGFSVRPETLVTFLAASGTRNSGGCLEAVIRADGVHLRCEGPQGSTITIDGKFLTRLATTRLDAAVLSALVMVRSGSGEVLYSARDRFVWRPAD